MISKGVIYPIPRIVCYLIQYPRIVYDLDLIFILLAP